MYIFSFRDPTPPSGGFSKKETKKFVKYSIYVWVGSILLSTFIYIMDQVLLNEQRVKNPGRMYQKPNYFNEIPYSITEFVSVFSST